MHTPKTLRPLTAGVSCLVQLSLVMASVGAQHPVLAPTSDTTIVVSTAALHYSAITIPAGVTVRFVALLTFLWAPGADTNSGSILYVRANA